MPVMIHCPECQDRYEVSDEAAEKLVRCRRCQCPIDANRQEAPVDAIQAIGAPAPASKPRKYADDDRAYDGPLHHRSPRAPFPLTALLLVVIGLLFFLLAFSVGFNIWFISRVGIQDDARRAEQQAVEQARKAEQIAALAREQELRAIEARKKAEQELLRLHLKDFNQDPKQAAFKQSGVLKGRVRLQGDPPAKRNFKKEIAIHKDGQVFLKGPEEDLLDPTWTINPDNQGVANVVISLRAADGKPLAIPPQLRKPRPNILLETPGANFRPHILVLTPNLGDFDTGEKLLIRNSSAVAQNINFKTGPRNIPINRIFLPGEDRETSFVTDPQPIRVVSEIYGWMSANIWVFDHPFHAITDKNGAFEIPFAPRDVNLRLIIWHEAIGFVDGKDGRAYRLEAEQDVQELFIRAK